MVIGVDRQEKGRSELSAIQEVEQSYNIPVVSIVNLGDIIRYLELQGGNNKLDAIKAYRDQYGV